MFRGEIFRSVQVREQSVIVGTHSRASDTAPWRFRLKRLPGADFNNLVSRPHATAN